MSLICGHAPVRAQPTGARVPDAESLTRADDELNSTDDESIVVDNADDPWSRGVLAEDRRAARKRLLEGNHLYEVPLYDKAAEQYAAALSKWKHPAIYFNLAQAQLQLGREIDARASLELALEYGEKPLHTKRFHKAQSQLEEVTRQLGRIRVTCSTPKAEVTLDGMTLFIGPGSYEGWVKAKSHEITAKAVDYLSDTRRVNVESEALQDVELKLVTLSQATDASRRWATWKPWGIIAAGGVVAAAGGVLHALAFRNFDSFDNDFRKLSCASEPPEAPPGCTEMDIGPKLNDQLRHAQRQQAIAIGSYVAGGSLIAAGVVLLYMNRPQLREGRASRSSVGSISVIPTISDYMTGVMVNVSR